MTFQTVSKDNAAIDHETTEVVERHALCRLIASSLARTQASQEQRQLSILVNAAALVLIFFHRSGFGQFSNGSVLNQPGRCILLSELACFFGYLHLEPLFIPRRNVPFHLVDR